MEINIASAIEEILDRRETVTLIGVGSLILENLSAKVSKSNETIAPPSAKLNFYDVQTDNKPLRKYLTKKYDLSKKEANKAIKKFSTSILNSIANYGEVNIEGIAKIKRDKGKLQVKALESYKSRYYGGLPEIPLTKVKNKKADKAKALKIEEKKAVLPLAPSKLSAPEVKKANTPTPAKTQSTVPVYDPPTQKPTIKNLPPRGKVVYTPPAKPATPALTKPIVKPQPVKSTEKLTVPAIEKKTPQPSMATKPTSTSQVKTATMSLNEKLAQSSSSSRASVAKTISDVKPIGKSTYTPVPPKEEKFGCLGPFLSLLGLLLLLFLLWKGFSCMYYKYNGGADKQNIAAVDAHSSSDDAESDTYNSSSESSESVTAVNSEDGLKECIIITGSFSRYQNVDKMERLLESKGYDVYVEEYGPYTRVGFRFDCSEEDLPSYLNRVRRNVSSKAWYLLPELYVEYK